MDKFDAIIIGGGIGGLSTAAFLAKNGVKVIVLEKHNTPGGFAASFERNGCRFDIGLEGLYELGEKNVIPFFLNYLGKKIATHLRKENFRIFNGGLDIRLHSGSYASDLASAFPGEKAGIEKFFRINKKIMDEMSGGGAPKPPYEMNLFEKIAMGIGSLFTRPTLMRYGFRDAVPVLKKLFKDRRVAETLYAKLPTPAMYTATAYRWNVADREEVYYPEGGMQAIADTLAASIRENGGQVILNKEVNKVLIDESGEKPFARGVKCVDGEYFYADTVISNSSPHHLLNKMIDGVFALEQLRKTISQRKVFPGAMLSFTGVDGSYDFGGYNYFGFMGDNPLSLTPEKATPENCPFAMFVAEKPHGQKNHSAIIYACLPYSYHNNWESGPNGERGEAYRKVKDEAHNVLLERVSSKLGAEFEKAVLFSIPSTPVTAWRYTYSYQGSYIGWDYSRASLGKFLPHQTPVKGLYMVGQWVFPGFGIAGTMAGGYYLSRRLLAERGIDLDSLMKPTK